MYLIAGIDYYGIQILEIQKINSIIFKHKMDFDNKINDMKSIDLTDYCLVVITLN